MQRLCVQLLMWLAATMPVAAAADSDDLDRFLSERGLVAAPAPAGAPAVGDSRSTPPAPTAELVVAAMGSLGVPYRLGGNTFDSGYDCSGFVRAMYVQHMGVMLPRQAAQQAAATQEIGRSELQPGDLVFFNTLRRAYSHVGIYVGDHKFIHSPRSGAVVRIEDLRVGYWSRRFDGARRVVARNGAQLQPLQSADAASPSLPDLPSY